MGMIVTGGGEGGDTVLDRERLKQTERMAAERWTFQPVGWADSWNPESAPLLSIPIPPPRSPQDQHH